MYDYSQKLFIVYGVQAGLFACLASVFGKLAVGQEDIQRVCLTLGEHYELDLVAPCYTFSPIMRIICVTFIIACNSLMWLCFTKAMNISATAAAALAVNSAANFMFTALAGAALFGETLSWKWLLGTVLIVAGLFCINMSAAANERREEDKLKTS